MLSADGSVVSFKQTGPAPRVRGADSSTNIGLVRFTSCPSVVYTTIERRETGGLIESLPWTWNSNSSGWLALAALDIPTGYIA